MGASPIVVILTAAMAAAVLYAFICDLRAERLAKQMMTRVQHHDAAALETIPWFWRRFAKSTIKIRILRRTMPEALPTQEVQALSGLERRTLIGIVLSFAILVFLLVVSYALDLSWGGGTR